jgi:hypothetical protein
MIRGTKVEATSDLDTTTAKSIQACDRGVVYIESCKETQREFPNQRDDLINMIVR